MASPGESIDPRNATAMQHPVGHGAGGFWHKLSDYIKLARLNNYTNSFFSFIGDFNKP